MTDEGRVRDWFESSRAEVERYERLLAREDLPPDRPPMLKYRLGRELELLAIATLLLDEATPRASLRRAARASLDGVVEGREKAGEHGTASAPGLWRTLRSASLVDDAELLDAVRDEIDTLPARYPDRFPEKAVVYHRLRAIDALFAGDEETMTEHADTMRRQVEARDTSDASTTVVEGFVDEDPSGIESGIRRLCELQRDRMPDDSDERIRGDGLSRNALFFYTLAHEWGYDVDVNDEPFLELPPWRRG